MPKVILALAILILLSIVFVTFSGSGKDVSVEGVGDGHLSGGEDVVIANEETSLVNTPSITKAGDKPSPNEIKVQAELSELREVASLKDKQLSLVQNKLRSLEKQSVRKQAEILNLSKSLNVERDSKLKVYLKRCLSLIYDLEEIEEQILQLQGTTDSELAQWGISKEVNQEQIKGAQLKRTAIAKGLLKEVKIISEDPIESVQVAQSKLIHEYKTSQNSAHVKRVKFLAKMIEDLRFTGLSVNELLNGINTLR